jgi:hypothetical protein
MCPHLGKGAQRVSTNDSERGASFHTLIWSLYIGAWPIKRCKPWKEMVSSNLSPSNR